MRISDWSSDVCSSDLCCRGPRAAGAQSRTCSHRFDLGLMKPAAARAEIHATLVARGFTIADGSCPTFAGAVRVHGKKVDVLLEVTDTRLIERPHVHLVDHTQLDPEVIAHVEVDAGICSESVAGLSPDKIGSAS